MAQKSKMSRIQPGTPEMEAYLAVGYGGMTVAKAKAIIAERKQDPHLHPYEKAEEAQAFLAAYEGKPIAIDTEPGWKRTKEPS